MAYAEKEFGKLMNNEDEIKSLKDAIDSLVKDRHRLKTALAFYADPRTWSFEGFRGTMHSFVHMKLPIQDDCGKLAREALK